MGYYSSFEVLDTDIEDVQYQLQDITEYSWEFWGGSVRSGDSYKWYGWEDDLKVLAERNPSSYAVLERRGEESPDIERVIVYKGEIHVQSPEIRFPTFAPLPGLDTVVKAR